MRLEDELLEERRKALRKRERIGRIIAQDWIAFKVPDEEEEDDEEYIEQSLDSLEKALESQESQESQESLEQALESQESPRELSQDELEDYIEIPVNSPLGLALSSHLSQPMKVEPETEVNTELDEYLSQLPKLAPSNDAVADRDVKSTLPLRLNQGTMWGIPSVVMFCFVFCQKLQLAIGLHSSCSISPKAGRTFHNCFTEYHDCGYETQCTEQGGSSFARF